MRLSEGHVIPPPGQLAKSRYCKWHNTYSHTTNECNYFYRQVQLALKDGRLTMGDDNRMRLDIDLFPLNVNLINFKEKKVLVRTSEADTTQGKNVIISDEPRLKMIKPKSPEPGCARLTRGDGQGRVLNPPPTCYWKSMPAKAGKHNSETRKCVAG
jgi:hypothetical protein